MLSVYSLYWSNWVVPTGDFRALWSTPCSYPGAELPEGAAHIVCDHMRYVITVTTGAGGQAEVFSSINQVSAVVGGKGRLQNKGLIFKCNESPAMEGFLTLVLLNELLALHTVAFHNALLLTSSFSPPVNNPTKHALSERLGRPGHLPVNANIYYSTTICIHDRCIHLRICGDGQQDMKCITTIKLLLMWSKPTISLVSVLSTSPVMKCGSKMGVLLVLYYIGYIEKSLSPVCEI